MRLLLIASAFLLASCANSRPGVRVEVPHSGFTYEQSSALRNQPTDEAATQRWLDQQTGAQPEVQIEATPTAVEPMATDVPSAGAPAVDSREEVGAGAEEVTDKWLADTAEIRRIATEPPPPLPQQAPVVYVDRPVYVEDRRYGIDYDYEYDAYGNRFCDDGFYRGYPTGYYRARRFGGYGYGRGYRPAPINTALGAGIGALVSSRRHRGRGAAIGAGVGLLFDFANWSCR